MASGIAYLRSLAKGPPVRPRKFRLAIIATPFPKAQEIDTQGCGLPEAVLPKDSPKLRTPEMSNVRKLNQDTRSIGTVFFECSWSLRMKRSVFDSRT